MIEAGRLQAGILVYRVLDDAPPVHLTSGDLASPVSALILLTEDEARQLHKRLLEIFTEKP